MQNKAKAMCSILFIWDLLYSRHQEPTHFQDNTIILYYFLEGITFLNTRGSVSIQKEASPVAATAFRSLSSRKRAAQSQSPFAGALQWQLIPTPMLQCS